MASIINFKQYTNEDGAVFFALGLQKKIKMVKSQQTQRFYVTARKGIIPSTFDENTCKAMGSEMSGIIYNCSTYPS